MRIIIKDLLEVVVALSIGDVATDGAFRGEGTSGLGSGGQKPVGHRTLHREGCGDGNVDHGLGRGAKAKVVLLPAFSLRLLLRTTSATTTTLTAALSSALMLASMLAISVDKRGQEHDGQEGKDD